MVVTNLKGIYQAKSDNWQVIEGGKPRSTRSNLLVLTSKMARAVQLYLIKRGIKDVEVDGALMCVEPGMHVQSSHPIVRVVMRDAIEHFAISLNQASSKLTGNIVHTIVNVLADPRSIQARAAAVEASAPQPGDDSAGNPAPEDIFPWSTNDLDFEFKDDPSRNLEKPFSYSPETTLESSPVQRKRQSAPIQFSFDKNQWILLICFGVVEIIILLVFFWLVYSNS